MRWYRRPSGPAAGRPARAAAGAGALAACAAGGFTTLLDNTALTVAVPAMRQSLGLDARQVQWLVAGYSLAFALALVPGGRLGDSGGRKRLFLTGMAVFAGAGAVAAAGADARLLIACRLAQGVGAGLVNGQMIGTLQDRFSGAARTRALGVYAVSASVGAALGPVAGGTLIAAAGPDLGWRLVLLLALPFGAVTLLLAVRHLPAPPERARYVRGDLAGAAPFSVAVLALMLPLLAPPTPVVLLGCALAAVAAGVLFARSQRRSLGAGRRPFLAPALLRSGPYGLGTGAAMALFGGQTSAAIALTLFLQSGLHLPALRAAAVMLPQALAMALGSTLAGRAAHRWGRHAVTAGIALTTCALLTAAGCAALVPRAGLPGALAGTLFLLGAGVGLTTAPLQAQILQHAPARTAGVAGGLLQMAQRVAAAACAAAVTGLYLRHHPEDQAAHRVALEHAMAVCASLGGVGLVLHLGAVRRRPAAAPAAVPATGTAPPPAVHPSRTPEEPHHAPRHHPAGE